jgi:hypothetical protein
MSLWEFAACTLGAAMAKGAKVEEPLLPGEEDSIDAMLDLPPIWER